MLGVYFIEDLPGNVVVDLLLHLDVFRLSDEATGPGALPSLVFLINFFLQILTDLLILGDHSFPSVLLRLHKAVVLARIGRMVSLVFSFFVLDEDSGAFPSLIVAKLSIGVGDGLLNDFLLPEARLLLRHHCLI